MPSQAQYHDEPDELPVTQDGATAGPGTEYEGAAEAGLDDSTLATGAPGGAPSAQVLGMVAYLLGTGLMVATFVWAFFAFHGDPWKIHNTPLLSRPASIYSQWATEKLIFLLVLLLMTFSGWLIAGRGAQLYSGGSVDRRTTLGLALGSLVFCVSIGMIVLVFLSAMHQFGTGPGQVPVPAAHGGPPDYVGWALGGLFQILVLAIMALNGSLIAGRGVQLFLGSLQQI